MISRKGNLNSMLRIINIFICIISSYIYIWMAAFGNDPGGISFRFMLVFEVLFLIMMICNFFTDFTRDGENIPV